MSSSENENDCASLIKKSIALRNSVIENKIAYFECRLSQLSRKIDKYLTEQSTVKKINKFEKSQENITSSTDESDCTDSSSDSESTSDSQSTDSTEQCTESESSVNHYSSDNSFDNCDDNDNFEDQHYEYEENFPDDEYANFDKESLDSQESE